MMQADTKVLFALFVGVFSLTLIAAYLLSRLAPRLGLLALPGEHRRHQKATPMVGGLAIFLGLFLGLLLDSFSFHLLLPSLFLICLVGALDDRYALPSWSRFIAQGLAAHIMMSLTGETLIDLGAIFSSDSQMLLNHGWSSVMTIFACIGVINAINMSDGLDGLAGSLVLIILIALLIIGHPSQGLIVVVTSSVAAFLCWNLRVGRSQASIFMGDAGSMMLGLLIAYLLIGYSQSGDGILPVTALWLLALPLIDAVAVLIVRPLRGRSPFSADRIHYHHQLLDRGLSVNTTLLIAIALQLIFVVTGIVMWRVEVAEDIQLLLFLLLFSSYAGRLYYFSGKRSKS
jgi:UDP-GlcNAc:undecaprenyl-phosphate GlcNAc-1-phosphate transferase